MPSPSVTTNDRRAVPVSLQARSRPNGLPVNRADSLAWQTEDLPSCDCPGRWHILKRLSWACARSARTAGSAEHDSGSGCAWKRKNAAAQVRFPVLAMIDLLIDRTRTEPCGGSSVHGWPPGRGRMGNVPNGAARQDGGLYEAAANRYRLSESERSNRDMRPLVRPARVHTER
jgi:hypothetical protein